LDLSSSLTHGENTSTSSLPSPVIDETFTDTFSELSKLDQSAHASSSTATAHSPVTPRPRPARKIDAEQNSEIKTSLHLVQVPLVQPPELKHYPLDDSDQASAPSSDLRTLKEMSNQGLAAKHQSDALIANIRGHGDRSKLLVAAPAIQLAKILPISAAAPLMQFPPTTRAIGPTGRIRVRVNNQSLSELLSWVVGPLTVSPDGAWVILRVDVSAKARRRNDGRCTYTADNRLRLSQAICTYLGTPFGYEVALLALPEHGALALVNPARLLMGAPLSLFDSSNNSKQGGM
jgi:hypothetical protein